MVLVGLQWVNWTPWFQTCFCLMMRARDKMVVNLKFMFSLGKGMECARIYACLCVAFRVAHHCTTRKHTEVSLHA